MFEIILKDPIGKFSDLSNLAITAQELFWTQAQRFTTSCLDQHVSFLTNVPSKFQLYLFSQCCFLIITDELSTTVLGYLLSQYGAPPPNMGSYQEIWPVVIIEHTFHSSQTALWPLLLHTVTSDLAIWPVLAEVIIWTSLKSDLRSSSGVCGISHFCLLTGPPCNNVTSQWSLSVSLADFWPSGLTSTVCAPRMLSWPVQQGLGSLMMTGWRLRRAETRRWMTQGACSQARQSAAQGIGSSVHVV